MAGFMTHRTKREILFIQQEHRLWTSARMWGYDWHLGIEEGLEANDVHVTTLISSWMPRAREILDGKTFDQVWINDATHLFEPGGWEDYRLTEADLEWVATLAPVRVGFVIESLRYTQEEYAAAPFLANAYNVLKRTLPYLTHVTTPDENDVELIRGTSDTPVTWCITPAVPRQYVCDEVSVPPEANPVFFGTPYGERAKWLEKSELSSLLSCRPSKDNLTNLPQVFSRLHGQLLEGSLRSVCPGEPYSEYLNTLRELRRTAYRLHLESWGEGCAVVSLPPYAKFYPGPVYEGMAVGRPVIATEQSDRPRLRELFAEGSEILLYPRNDPSVLAGHIRRIRSDPELGRQVAVRARRKLLAFHTMEKRVQQILEWVDSGMEPSYSSTINDLPSDKSTGPDRSPSFGAQRPGIFDIFCTQLDKPSTKWSHYFDVYESFFAPLRDKDVSLLEIGIYKGGSLTLWEKYFKNPSIYAIDIDPGCKVHEKKGIKIYIGSQSDAEFLNRVVGESGKLDIVIDDGGHQMEQQIISFQTIFPHMKDGGIYIIEDLHTSYRSDYNAGLRKSGTAIEFLKGLVDSLNWWSYKTDEDWLDRHLESIHFYDSMCVLVKKEHNKPFPITKPD
ncbi:MAG: glycosyltransferase [Syntrophobacteraceae bacterium]